MQELNKQPKCAAYEILTTTVAAMQTLQNKRVHRTFEQWGVGAAGMQQKHIKEIASQLCYVLYT